MIAGWKLDLNRILVVFLVTLLNQVTIVSSSKQSINSTRSDGVTESE